MEKTERKQLVEWKNSMLDDVAGIIGFTATVLLAAIHGGNSLYIPASAPAGHPLVLLLGKANMAKLAEEFGGQTLHIPLLNDFDRWRTGVMAAAMHREGKDLHTIAAALGISHVHAGTLVQTMQPLRPRLRMRADHNMAAWCRSRIRAASSTGVSVSEQMQGDLFDGGAGATPQKRGSKKQKGTLPAVA